LPAEIALIGAKCQQGQKEAGLPVTTIIGSDIAHAVPLTLLAGLGHWWLGTINLLLLLSLLTGSIPGIVAGSDLTRFTPEGVPRPLLAAVLLLVAIKLLF